jgi:hypothetical protein
MVTEGLVDRVVKAFSALVAPPEYVKSFEFEPGTYRVIYTQTDERGEEVSRQTCLLTQVNGVYGIRNPDLFGPRFIPVRAPDYTVRYFEQDRRQGSQPS